MRRKTMFQKVMVALMAASIVATEIPVSALAASTELGAEENSGEDNGENSGEDNGEQTPTTTPSPTTTEHQKKEDKGTSTEWGDEDTDVKKAIASRQYVKDNVPAVTGLSYDAKRNILKWNSLGEGYRYRYTISGRTYTTYNNYVDLSSSHWDEDGYSEYYELNAGDKVQIQVSGIKGYEDSVTINGTTYYYYYDDSYKLHVTAYGTASSYTVTIPGTTVNSLGTLTIDDMTNYAYTFKTSEKANKGTTVELWYSNKSDFNNYKTAEQKKNYWTSLFTTSYQSSFYIYFDNLLPGTTYYAKARTKTTVKKAVTEQVYDAFDGEKYCSYDYDKNVYIYYIEEPVYSAFTNTVKFKVPVSDVSATAEVEKNKITLDIQASNNKLKSGYEIARKSGKKYKVLAKITGNVYEDKNLDADTKYSYRVRAYSYNPSTKKYTYGESYFFSKTTWGSDIKVQAVQTGKTKAKITWKKVAGADGYEIYAYDGSSVGKTISNGEFDSYTKKELVKTIKKASTTSYTVKSLTAGESYTFAVRAYKTTKSGKKTKKYFIDGVATINLTFDSLTNVKTKESANGNLKVSWSPAYASDGIKVEKYDNDKGQYVTYKNLKKTAKNITLKPEAVGKTTEYRIYTYKGNKKGTVYTYNVTGYLATPTNVKAKKTKDGEGVNISWKAVKGADYYVVYRSTELANYDSDTKSYTNVDSETTVPVYAFKAGDELANGFAPEYEYYYEIPYTYQYTYDQYFDADGNWLGDGNWEYGDRVYNYAATTKYYYSRIEKLKEYIEEAKKNNDTVNLAEYQKELAELNKQMAENPTYDEYNVKYTSNIVTTSVTDQAVVKTNNAAGNLLVKDYWAEASTAKNTAVSSSRKGQETVFYEGPSAGVTYYYYVKAFKYNTSEYDINYNGYDYAATSVGYSKPAKVTLGTTIKTPSISSAKSAKAKQVTIKWKKVTGASNYEIYRATSKKGTYELVGTVSSKKTSFTDKKLKSKKTYYYKIRATKATEAGADYATAYSSVKSAKVK